MSRRKQIGDGLIPAGNGKARDHRLVDDTAARIAAQHRRIHIAPIETLPGDERQKLRHCALGGQHSRRQAMGMPVGPAHAAAGAAGREMGPLNMAVIVVVEGLGQRDLLVLEAVDGSMLEVEERSALRCVADILRDQPPHRHRRVDGVRGIIDGAFLIDVEIGEIERRMAKDGVGKGEVGTPFHLRSEQRHRLRMGAANGCRARAGADDRSAPG